MADKEEGELRRSRSRSVSRSCSGYSDRRSVSRSRSHRRSPSRSRSSSRGRSRTSSRGRRRTRRGGGQRARSATSSSDEAEANNADIEEARLLLESGIVKFCDAHGTSLAASTCTPCRLVSRMVKPAVLTQLVKHISAHFKHPERFSKLWVLLELPCGYKKN